MIFFPVETTVEESFLCFEDQKSQGASLNPAKLQILNLVVWCYNLYSWKKNNQKFKKKSNSEMETLLDMTRTKKLPLQSCSMDAMLSVNYVWISFGLSDKNSQLPRRVLVQFLLLLQLRQFLLRQVLRQALLPQRLRPIRLLLVFLLLVVFLGLPLLLREDYNHSCSTTTTTFPVSLPKTYHNDSCQTTQKFRFLSDYPKIHIKQVCHQSSFDKWCKKNILQLKWWSYVWIFFIFFITPLNKKIDYVECDNLSFLI